VRAAAIMHLYNRPRSSAARVDFGLGTRGIKDIAVKGAQLSSQLEAEMRGYEVVIPFSPVLV